MGSLYFSLQIIIGTFFRRWWGGWLNPNHILKVLLAYPLAFLSAYAQTGNIYASATFAAIIGTAFNNPLHSWGMGMGDTPSRPAWQCVLVMGGSYGAFTTLAAAGLVYWTDDVLYWWYGANGFLAAAAYYAFHKLYPKGYTLWSGFLDGTLTAPAECVLGALLLGV